MPTDTPVFEKLGGPPDQLRAAFVKQVFELPDIAMLYLAIIMVVSLTAIPLMILTNGGTG